MFLKFSLLISLCKNLSDCNILNHYKNDYVLTCDANVSENKCYAFEKMCQTQFYAVSNTHALSVFTRYLADAVTPLEFINQVGVMSHQSNNVSVCYAPELKVWFGGQLNTTTSRPVDLRFIHAHSPSHASIATVLLLSFFCMIVFLM